MTRLVNLHSRLSALGRRRAAARWAVGLSALALAVIAVLAVLFLVDWTFTLGKLDRVVTMLIALGVLAWAAKKFVMPWLTVQESELDLALLVERKQKIDSDLVAALQFESAEASQWGSRQLETAVIDYVVEFSADLQIPEGLDGDSLRRRGRTLAAVALGLVVLAALFPAHLKTFFARLMLDSRHYPSRTVLEQIVVNGQAFDWTAAYPAPIKCAYGLPLSFTVRTSGQLPDSARAELVGLSNGLSTTVELERQPAGEPTQAVYVGKLNKLVDSLTFSVLVGDAWTDEAQVLITPLPVVETRLIATSPAYARSEDSAPEPTGARQISVLEGSRVDLEVTCHNKTLVSAALSIEGKEFALKSVQQGTWRLDAAGTPLENITAPVRYQLQVVDEDGLKLEHAIEGFIRIKADQKPQITTDVVTRFVLPAAEPEVEFRVSDDHGIARIAAYVQAIDGEGNQLLTATGENTPPPPADPTQLKPLALMVRQLEQPLLKASLPLRDVYKLKLSAIRVQLPPPVADSETPPPMRTVRPRALVKGDQLKVTFEVTDYRGTSAGQSTVAEPIVLQVTDESGVLAAISESDERSAKQLDVIIKRQLGIGENK